MRTNIISALLAGGLTLAAGSAFAGEPLSDAQMDTVSAGAAAINIGLAGSGGNIVSASNSDSFALAVPGLAVAAGQSEAAALSFGGPPAVAGAFNASAVALP